MSRITQTQLDALLAKPGYTIGHCAFAPVAPGIPNPIPQLDARQEPLDLDQDEATGGPRIVVCITRCGTKLLDKDNLYGGAKPLCDALRYEKIIPEDNPEAIHLIVQQRKVKRKDIGTLIEITPIK
jgi:hypothetical protein